MSDPLNLNLLLNPFETVMYPKIQDHPEISPHSRTLNTNLWQKIKDTFEVFHGGTYVFSPDNKKGELAQRGTRPGIFDYATLFMFKGIHLLFTKLYLFNFPDDEDLKSIREITGAVTLIPLFILFIAHMVGNGILRNVFSLALTVAVFPLVAVSHAISSLVEYFKEKKYAQKEVQVLENANVPGTTDTFVLKTLDVALGKAPLHAIKRFMVNDEKQLVTIDYKDSKNTLRSVTMRNNFLPEEKGELISLSGDLRESEFGKPSCRPRYH
jgi:hypothetical protein